jgi:hypothetical protein
MNTVSLLLKQGLQNVLSRPGLVGAGATGAVGIQHFRVPLAPNQKTPVRSKPGLGPSYSDVTPCVQYVKLAPALMTSHVLFSRPTPIVVECGRPTRSTPLAKTTNSTPVWLGRASLTSKASVEVSPWYSSTTCRAVMSALEDSIDSTLCSSPAAAAAMNAAPAFLASSATDRLHPKTARTAIAKTRVADTSRFTSPSPWGQPVSWSFSEKPTYFRLPYLEVA